MKNLIKNQKEIELMRRGGQLLGQITKELIEMVHPGLDTAQLEDRALRRITEAGGEPAFLGFREGGEKPFPTALCLSLNDEVVHAPALPARILKNGDLLKIDVGMKWPSQKGLYTDMAVTVFVGQPSPLAFKLSQATEKALSLAIKEVHAGVWLSEICQKIEAFIRASGFSPVLDLTGHGIGHRLHEKPYIPNYWHKDFPDFKLETGMTLCFEPMVCAGSGETKVKEDSWTICTADGSLAAHFEHTVLVREKDAEILTLMI